MDLLGAIAKWLFEKGLNAFTQQQDAKVSITKTVVDGQVQVEVAQSQERIAKYQIPWFWILASLFIVPLAFWWLMVILDSIFYFPFDIADLPTENMQEWAGEMIRFMFYTGVGAAGIRAVFK